MADLQTHPESAPCDAPNAARVGNLYTQRFLLVALLLLAGASRLPGLDGHLVDLDAWRQTDTASIARLFLEEPNILYPRIYWGAPGPGYVEAEFQLYPFAVSLLYRVFGENALYGRLLSVLLGLLSAGILYRIARRYLTFWPSYAAVAFFLFSPIVFRFSRQFMPEMSMLFFYLLALERFLAFLDEGRWRTVLVAAFSMCLAILIKPTSIHLGLALMALSFIYYGRRAWINPKLFAFAVISLAPPALYYIHAMNVYFEYGNTFGVIAGGDSKWTRASQFVSVQFYRTLAGLNNEWVLGTVGSVVALIGFFMYRAKGWLALLGWWAASFGICCLALGRYTGDYGRGLQYHIFSAPLLALAAGGGLAVIHATFTRYRFHIFVPCAIVTIVIAYQVNKDRDLLFRRFSMAQYEAGKKLAELSEPAEFAVVLSRDVKMDDGRENNYQEPRVFYYAHRWGRSLARDEQTPEHLSAALTTSKAQWFVNFSEFNDLADAHFLPWIEKNLHLAASTEGYQIYRIPTGRSGAD